MSDFPTFSRVVHGGLLASLGRRLSISVVFVVLAGLLVIISPLPPFSQPASASDVFYDFVSQASSASWSSGAGGLTFPGSDNDSSGFALYRGSSFLLEDDSSRSQVLETHPEWVSNGWIMGRYPPLTVPADAELRVIVGFLKGASGSDGVDFVVQFEEGQTRQTMLSRRATYDGELDSVTPGLSSIAGKTGHFILYVDAGQSSGQDWAIWAEAQIVTAPELPDLVTTEVREENGIIRYRIVNQGEGSVGSTTFCNGLFVDGELVATDYVNIQGMLPGQWIDNPFDYQWQATLPEHEIEVCADWEDDVSESNEQNNCLEETFVSGDTTPPVVTITYSPAEVTTLSEVTFTAQARDDSEVTELEIYINEEIAQQCLEPAQGVDEKGREYWECSYTGGPYDEGELICRAEALDQYHNRGTSAELALEVAPLTITPPPPTYEMCWYSISGTIESFPYRADTLSVRVCEAEIILLNLEGEPQRLTQCKEGGSIWYADVVRLMEGDMPGPDLEYYLGNLCPGEYVVAPVFNPASDVCQWQGKWRTARGSVVTIEDSSVSGVDFIFTPLDTRSPVISSIWVEPEQPEYGKEATINILAEDDREIVSIWQKTDTLGLDGSVHYDYWHELAVTPGLEGSTAGAQFSFIAHDLMTATVTVKVCDTGGNSHTMSKVITCGSCSDGIQNQGETGVDCGGPCPSQCVECLTDYTRGDAPSAYLYSPDDDATVHSAAIDALYEYANEIGVSVLALDTGDPYRTTDNFVRAVSWWIPRHMGYRGDDLNERCLDEALSSPYEPSDYDHGDFPVPAAYTLRYSGAAYVTDGVKDYFGDCEDFAILASAMLRSLGVCHECVFNAEQPGHGFNIVYYEGKYRVMEPQSFTIGCEDYGPEFIWNDRIGAYASSDFAKVRPWQYTMNYPYCERPTVSVSGGGFGPKELWLDWEGWGENTEVAVGDFDDDGRDDIAAVWYEGGYFPYQASVLFSSGSGFEIPSDSWPRGRDADFSPLVFRAPGRDYIIAPEGDTLCCVQGTPRTGPVASGHVYLFRYGEPVRGVVALADPDGEGAAEVLEFHQGDDADVYVNGTLWNSDFSPREEIPLVGDFDGDGYDDAVSFERGYGGVRVIRSVPGADRFTMFCLWHDEFCLDEETPMVGDFNGDGRQDIVSFDTDDGEVYVGLSTVFGFWSDGLEGSRALWQTDFCEDSEIPLTGDFNGDGLDDIGSFSLDNGRARVWVSRANPSTLTYDFRGGSLCERAHFYLDAYSPSICP